MKFGSFILTEVSRAASSFAEETPESIIKSELRSLYLIEKDSYRNPELSAHEECTSELIAKKIKTATAPLFL